MPPKKQGKKGAAAKHSKHSAAKAAAAASAAAQPTTASAAASASTAAPSAVAPAPPAAPPQARTGGRAAAGRLVADLDVGRTPLHCAASHGHLEVVRVLLAAEATNVAALDKQGRTALMEAVRANQEEVVSFMLSDARASKTCNVMDAEGQVPLLAAIQLGYTPIAKALLKSRHVDVCVVGYGTMPNRHPPLGPGAATPAAAAGGAPPPPPAKTRISLPPDSRPARANRLAGFSPAPLAPDASATIATATDAPHSPSGSAAGSDVDVLDPAPYQPDLSRHSYPEGGAGLTAVTPLHLAAGTGNAEVVAALLDHPTAAAQLQQDHTLLSVFVLQTPLHLAVQAGCDAAVRLLLAAGHQVDVPSARLGHTALHRAAALGHVGIAQLLLAHGANPKLPASVPYGDGQLEHGYNVLALLLHDGALNPEGVDLPLAAMLLGAEGGLPGEPLLAARTGVMRKTALHLAVGGGVCAARDAQRAPVLELLLDRPEVDVNARDALGNTPLILAAQQLQFRDAPVVSLLLTHAHIDVTLADEHLHKTALHYAGEYGGAELAKACLAVKSAMVNEQDSLGQTPLMLAAAAGNVAVAELMLQQACVNANARDWQGQAALHLAVAAGNADMVALLCANAPVVDVNALDSAHFTPLHTAAATGHVATLDVLLATPGLDTSAGCYAAGSPVQVACAGKASGDAAAAVGRLAAHWQHSDETRAVLRHWFEPYGGEGVSGLVRVHNTYG